MPRKSSLEGESMPVHLIVAKSPDVDKILGVTESDTKLKHDRVTRHEMKKMVEEFADNNMVGVGGSFFL